MAENRKRQDGRKKVDKRGKVWETLLSGFTLIEVMVAVAIVVSVQQPVRIERLDASFRIPTSSLTRLIFVDDHNAPTTCQDEVVRIVDFLARRIRDASR